MSDRVVQTVNETNGRIVQPLQTYQSVWMSHWMRTGCKETPETLNLASGSGELGYGIKGDNLRHGLTTGKRPAETENRTTEMMYSTKMSIERLGFGSSILKHSWKTDDMQVPRAVMDLNFERRKDVDVSRGVWFPSVLRGVPYASDTSSRRFHPLDEVTSTNHLEWIEDHPSAEESCFVALKPLQETFAEPSSLSVLYKHELGEYGLHKGKTEVSSIICGADVSKNQFQKMNLRVQEHVSCNKHNQSADLLCQGKNDNRSQSVNLRNDCFREKNAPLLFDVPSTSHNHLPTFNQKWFQKMRKCSGLRLYPDRCIVSEETEAKKSYYNCYSLHKLPDCLHNLETMRICTTIEEGNIRGVPRFSQTSRSLLITKTTDFNLSNEFDIFDATTIITEVNGNIACQGKRGVILQQLSCSAESERKGNVRDVNTRKETINNESSAETDTMDMDYCKNLYSGANSTPSDKALNMNSNLSYPVDVFFSKETESRAPNTKLPDINLELPSLPAAAALSENSGRSSSKTQSLEMDMLMAHAEPYKPNSNLSLEDSREADPGNRWIKRLKLSSSQSFSQGTNSFNLAENSHDKKLKKNFGRTPMNGFSSLEPYSRMLHGKESMPVDNKGTLSINTEVVVSPTKKSMELFSRPWIQRWLHDESHGTRDYTETAAFCALDDHQKEHLPSIRAMAMMGKAMRGFQSCDLQKRGSFTVWNTKTI